MGSRAMTRFDKLKIAENLRHPPNRSLRVVSHRSNRLASTSIMHSKGIVATCSRSRVYPDVWGRAITFAERRVLLGLVLHQWQEILGPVAFRLLGTTLNEGIDSRPAAGRRSKGSLISLTAASFFPN
jgi:hypothetical protein